MIAAPPKDEGVYVEYIAQGSVLKVSAIDPKTGTEVSVFGPAGAREALTRTAMQKLVYVMKKGK